MDNEDIVTDSLPGFGPVPGFRNTDVLRLKERIGVIIIWGTKTREELLGTVADWCPACRAVRAFSVTEYYQVGHIYYISLGRGSLAATVRQCWECRSQYYCQKEDYAEFLSTQSAGIPHEKWTGG